MGVVLYCVSTWIDKAGEICLHMETIQLLSSVLRVYLILYLICAFPKFRKAAVRFVMSVRPSAWKNSDPTGRIFIKFGI